MSDTDHGAKHERRPQVERVNGVLHAVARKSALRPTAQAAITEQLTDDSPIRAIVERPKPSKRVQHFTPSRRFGTQHDGEQRPRASEGFVPRAGQRPVSHACLVVETPSLLHMAQARQAQLREIRQRHNGMDAFQRAMAANAR